MSALLTTQQDCQGYSTEKKKTCRNQSDKRLSYYTGSLASSDRSSVLEINVKMALQIRPVERSVCLAITTRRAPCVEVRSRIYDARSGSLCIFQTPPRESSTQEQTE